MDRTRMRQDLNESLKDAAERESDNGEAKVGIVITHLVR